MQPNEAPKFMVHADATAATQAIKAASTSLDSSGPHTNTVTIRAGATTAVVKHGLGKTPDTVTVQFPPDALKMEDKPDLFVESYVVLITPETFQVNLTYPLDHDVNFIWSVS